MAATTTRVPHGRYTRYTTGGCRCELCHAAMLRYNKRRLALIERGEWQPWADAKAVRRHVEALRKGGVRLESIATLARVSPANIYKLLTSTRGRVRAEFAEKLLSVTADAAPPPRARVDATGTRRRLQALMWLGWSATYLAERLGMDRSFIRKVTSRAQVEGTTARAVRELFEALSGSSPPAQDRYERANATRMRRFAEARGWVPPMAWDDIDDPKEQPKGVRREAS